MLNTGQKAKILAKAGVAIPAFPARRLPIQERHLLRGEFAPPEELEADAEQAAAVDHWTRYVGDLYAVHMAARAARSLRESEEASSLYRLQMSNAAQHAPHRASEAGAQ